MNYVVVVPRAGRKTPSSYRKSHNQWPIIAYTSSALETVILILHQNTYCVGHPDL